jgi:hypothetical protein
MSTLPAPVPLIVTEHFDAFSLQVFEEKVTVPAPETCDQVMVPVCRYVGDTPVTVAVQVTFVPFLKDDLVHDIVVRVNGFVVTVMVDV